MTTELKKEKEEEADDYNLGKHLKTNINMRKKLCFF
jgi:hypothetical protein